MHYLPLSANLGMACAPARAAGLVLAGSILLGASMQAVETQDDTPALAAPLRAQWRQSPIDAVLGNLAALAGCTLSLSKGMQARVAAHEVVTVVDECEQPTIAVLREIEDAQDAQFRIGDGRMLVETGEEADARPAQTALCYQASQPLVVPDVLEPKLHQPVNILNNQRKPGEQDKQADECAGVADVATELANALGGKGSGFQAASDNGDVYLTDTPHRLAVILHRFYSFVEVVSAKSQISCTAGVLPAGERAPGGLEPDADAAALIARLQRRHAVLIGGDCQEDDPAPMDGEQRAMTQFVDIVSSQYEPVFGSAQVGLSMRVQAEPGLGSHRFVFTGMVREQTALAHVSARGGVSVTGNASFPDPKTVQCDLPTYWSWLPQGCVDIPSGRSLVLSASSPAGTMVLVMQPEDAPVLEIPALMTFANPQATLGDALATIAADCHAGLLIERGAADTPTLAAPLSMQARMSWAQIASALASKGVMMVPESDHLRVIAIKPDRNVVVTLPIWSNRGQAVLSPKIPHFLGLADAGKTFSIDPCPASAHFDTFEEAISGMREETTDAKAMNMMGDDLIFAGRCELLPGLIQKLIEREQGHQSDLQWSLYALPDGSEGRILSPQQWAAIKDQDRLLLATFTENGGEEAACYFGTQRRYVANGEVVQSLHMPTVSDLVLGDFVAVRSRLHDGWLEVEARLNVANESASRTSTIKDSNNLDVLTIESPSVSQASFASSARLPPGSAMVLSNGVACYALTCAALAH